MVKRGLEDQAANTVATPAKKLMLKSNYYSPLTKDDGTPVVPETHEIRPREPKIPPIILHQELSNPKDTLEKIQSWAKAPVYFKTFGNVRHIYATKKDDFIIIKEQLKLIKFGWTSYNAEDDVHKKLVLRGIDKSYTESDVYEDLITQFDAVVRVKQLTKKTEDGKQIPIGVYIVYFKWNTILSVAKKVIKYCCHHKISWSYFHSTQQKQVKQCFNCQGFGHFSANCGLKNRCVKCVGNHSPGKCTKTKENGKAACCNCGGDHPASYKGCIKAKEYLANLSKPQHSTKKVTKKEVNGIAFDNRVKRKLSFRDVIQGNKTTATPKNKNQATSGQPNPNQHLRSSSKVSSNLDHGSDEFIEAQGFSYISSEIDSLFGMPFTELMNTVRSFLPVYKRCKDVSQRKLLLIEFLFKLSP